MKYDVLSLGPARMDVFVRLPDMDVDEICSIDRKRCVIELGFGEKIAVRDVKFAVGGNAGNNAVGLTRLGYKTALVATIGGGKQDQEVKQILTGEGVDTTWLATEGDDFGMGVVINYQEERTILSHYAPVRSSFAIGEGVEAAWIYLTSMGENWEGFYKQALEWANTKGVKVAFNPGGRQLKGDILPVLGKTEILFVNREEAQAMLKSQIPNPKDILEGLYKLGPKVVVMTDGPEGAYLFDGTKYWHAGIVPAPVVERTGAGDAFGAGFMAGILGGTTVQEALKWGSVNSASVLGYVGPQAGLLHKEQMAEWLAKAQNGKVEEL